MPKINSNTKANCNDLFNEARSILNTLDNLISQVEAYVPIAKEASNEPCEKCRQYLFPNSRHFLSTLKRSDTENTIFVTTTREDVQKDVDEINNCNIKLNSENRFITSSGRIYGFHSQQGTSFRLFPTGGTGTVTLSSREYDLLVLLKKNPDSFEKRIIHERNILPDRVTLIRYLGSL